RTHARSAGGVERSKAGVRRASHAHLRRSAHRRRRVEVDGRIHIHRNVGVFESARISKRDFVDHYSIAVGIQRDRAGSANTAGVAGGGASTVAMGIGTADQNDDASVDITDGTGIEVNASRYARVAADWNPREAYCKSRALRGLASRTYAGVVG